MNWSELEDPALHAPAAQAPAAAGAHALFPGDRGDLALDARRALCQLLAGPSIDAQRHAQLWPALLGHEDALRARLSELFLELVIDRDMGVAFTRQADTGELDTPTLLRTAPLTFLDSVLLLHLRQQLAEADAQGLRAVVAEAGLVEAMGVYEKNLSTDRAGFERRIGAAIVKMRESHVLTRLRGSEDRYEVSPALKLLFPAEDVQALAGVYRALREAGTAAAESSDSDADPSA
ncbi:DUF4194 domain-containing protein [Coralloluteibacterium stylophorae]|uniref:DUF4194 domain-containing protein n=1 Tax=Coralloluteibacterium stylophorae TaxID=1776034 RepID=A0A8J7VQK4_9GAMM|nr:DUF4194 domain-containing protein [Coralloluteibacterium stylophorae]MBS7458087.1 DUF4194 domain-containing protein [Coralloluteibacterium stylophorae]